VPVLLASGITGEGIEAVAAHVAGNRTLALIGASGVGKSTLANALAGEQVMETGDIMDTARMQRFGRGRHTTTARHLLPLPGGGCLIDTPGLRSFALMEAGEGVSRAFSDIEELAVECRFRDCAHEGEPGCAVRQAIDDGELDQARMDSMRHLERELAHERRKPDPLARAEAGRQRRRQAKGMRKREKERPKRRGR
jgi:ribosome biogenesis GTPase